MSTSLRPGRPANGARVSAEIRPGAPLEDAAGDDRALDLARPLPDAIDAKLAVEAGSRVLDHVPATAERLHRAVGDAAGHLGRVQLRPRDLPVDDPPVREHVERTRRVVGEQPRLMP